MLVGMTPLRIKNGNICRVIHFACIARLVFFTIKIVNTTIVVQYLNFIFIARQHPALTRPMYP